MTKAILGIMKKGSTELRSVKQALKACGGCQYWHTREWNSGFTEIKCLASSEHRLNKECYVREGVLVVEDEMQDVPK